MSRDRLFRIAVREFAPFESAIAKQWETFEATAHTGLTLECRAFDLHALQTALLDEPGLASGDWDIAFLNTDWVPFVAQTDLVVDLAPFLRRHAPMDFPDGWTPSLLRLQEHNGKIIGVPYHDGPECLIYRSDLFSKPAEQAEYLQQFGRPLRVPRSWREFHQVARFFHRPASGFYGTVLAAFPDGHNTVYDYLLQVWTRGGDLFDKAGDLRFDSPESIAGLAFYRALLNDASAVHPRSREMDSVAAGLAFAAGEVALTVNWFGFAAMSETVESSRVKHRVAVAPVPSEPPGVSASLNIYWLLAIPSGSLHKPLAYEFLRHCLTPAMDRLVTEEGAIGCRKSTWSDPHIQLSVPFYDQLETLHSNAREIPKISNWPLVAAQIDRLITRLIHSDEPVEQIVREFSPAAL